MSGDVEMLQLSSLLVIADSLSEGPMLIMKGRKRADNKIEIRPGIYQTINCTSDCRLRFPFQSGNSDDLTRVGQGLVCCICPFAMLRCPIGQSGPLSEMPMQTAPSLTQLPPACRSPYATSQQDPTACKSRCNTAALKGGRGCNRSLGSWRPDWGCCSRLISGPDTWSPRDAGHNLGAHSRFSQHALEVGCGFAT